MCANNEIKARQNSAQRVRTKAREKGAKGARARKASGRQYRKRARQNGIVSGQAKSKLQVSEKKYRAL